MIRQFLIFLALTGLIYACGGNDNSEQSNRSENIAQADNGPDGEKIYKVSCRTCHGLRGDMGASGAANLQDSELALADRITVITKGRGAMNAFENMLDADEIEAVAKFTMSLKK